MPNDFHDFSVRLNVLADALSGAAMEGVMTRLGVEAKKDATLAANRDLGGDARFSRWAKAGELAVRFDHVGTGAIEITPTPRTRGPWKVAESGRSAGMSRGTRARKSRRVSASRGKDTFTDATKEIEQESPQRALDALDDVIRGVLGG